MARAQIEAGSARTPSGPRRVGHRDEVLGRLGDELGREAVQARDAPLAVVAGQARVRRALVAREAVPAGAAHRRADEIPAREPVAVGLDPCQQLVAEDELLLAVGRDAEQALGDLAVGAAHPDAHGPQQDLVRRRDDVGDLGDPRGVRAGRAW